LAVNHQGGIRKKLDNRGQLLIRCLQGLPDQPAFNHFPLQRFIGSLQFARSFLDQPFQVFAVIPEFLFGLPAPGNISVAAPDSEQLSVIALYGKAQLFDPAFAPIRMLEPEFNGCRSQALCFTRMKSDEPLAIRRVDDAGEQVLIPLKVAGLIAGKAFARRRVVDDAAVRAGPEFPVMSVVCHHAVLEFRLL